MKILKIIGITLLVIILLLSLYLANLGLFSTMKVDIKQMGPYTIAYQQFIGPYAQTQPIFDNVSSLLKSKGLNPTKGLGIYYDDPAKVPSDQLRSDCGSILEGEDLKKLSSLKGTVKLMNIIKSKAFVTTFPIKGNLSYMVGPMKAYPALVNYAAKHNLKLAKRAYEIYDMPANLIYYVFEILE